MSTLKTRLSVSDELRCKTLAEEITADLFKSGSGKEAYTLQLRDRACYYLGGWCREAVQDRFFKMISSALAERRKKARADQRRRNTERKK